MIYTCIYIYIIYIYILYIYIILYIYTTNRGFEPCSFVYVCTYLGRMKIHLPTIFGFARVPWFWMVLTHSHLSLYCKFYIYKRNHPQYIANFYSPYYLRVLVELLLYTTLWQFHHGIPAAGPVEYANRSNDHWVKSPRSSWYPGSPGSTPKNEDFIDQNGGNILDYTGI